MDFRGKPKVSAGPETLASASIGAYYGDKNPVLWSVKKGPGY